MSANEYLYSAFLKRTYVVTISKKAFSLIASYMYVVNAAKRQKWNEIWDEATGLGWASSSNHFKSLLTGSGSVEPHTSLDPWFMGYLAVLLLDEDISVDVVTDSVNQSPGV